MSATDVFILGAGWAAIGSTMMTIAYAKHYDVSRIDVFFLTLIGAIAGPCAILLILGAYGLNWMLENDETVMVGKNKPKRGRHDS